MKKIVSLALTLILVLSCMAVFASCNEPSKNPAGEELVPVAKEEIKVGFIFLHDEKSTYDKNFMMGVEEVQTKLGLRDDQIIMMTGIPEGAECTEAALDLVDQGCDVIFANSFGHEEFLAVAAKDHPEVQFCHATGTTAHTSELNNLHNAFASIYEGRYLAGIAAGMKLNEMIANGEFSAEEAKIGYVGAFTYAEVISGYTSFYLGAKSVCPTVTMDVQFTGSWYDVTAENEAAKALIARNCKLISQHADSMGAPSACEEAGIPNVSYNGSTQEACPSTFIVSSRINWAPYYEYMINQVIKGEAIADDWTGTLATDSVLLTAINTNVAAEGTQAAIDSAKDQLKAGTLHVFDTKNFTVNGEKLTSYKADVDTDDAFTPDTEVIENGVFFESKFRSAPYFALKIDGITLVNEKF
ncbi:MAG: BMP family ABC transporter substrate-binding protein [Ruminococcaceae bacterium]|nr:BMP family ABC transporter substrate-binding protein [Oscillospiraceae bacterium]